MLTAADAPRQLAPDVLAFDDPDARTGVTLKAADVDADGASELVAEREPAEWAEAWAYEPAEVFGDRQTPLTPAAQFEVVNRELVPSGDDPAG